MHKKYITFVRQGDNLKAQRNTKHRRFINLRKNVGHSHHTIIIPNHPSIEQVSVQQMHRKLQDKPTHSSFGWHLNIREPLQLAPQLVADGRCPHTDVQLDPRPVLGSEVGPEIRLLGDFAYTAHEKPIPGSTGCNNWCRLGKCCGCLTPPPNLMVPEIPFCSSEPSSELLEHLFKQFWQAIWPGLKRLEKAKEKKTEP